METTEYQSRIEGLNGTALVLPLSAPVVMSRVDAMYWFSRVSLEITDYVGLLTISWNVSGSQKKARVLRTLFEFDDCLIAGRWTENQVITGSGFHHRFHRLFGNLQIFRGSFPNYSIFIQLENI